MNINSIYELPKEMLEVSEKELKLNWYRKSASMMNIIGEMEAELKRMKANPKVPGEVVQQKDSQINELVDFYNSTVKTIDALFLQIKIYKINEKINTGISNGIHKAGNC